jgi:hypothetical protein
MARGHGRILTSIWEDSDFLALDEQQQRLYLFLISQPNLNHAGLLPLTLRRWARKAAGLTATDLEKRLHALAHARFLVIDDDTEELLIRSFVRNDGVWKQPRVMGAMVSGALEISSPALRAALLAEMDRIPLDELSDEPTKSTRGPGPSIREQVAEHIDALRKAFGTPTPPPTRGTSATPSATPSTTPSASPDEGDPQGSTRVRAEAHVRVAPAPAPPPSPIPSPIGEGDVPPQHSRPAPATAPKRPDGRTHIPDDFAPTDAMRRWAISTFGEGLDLEYETQQFVSHHRAEASRRHSWPDEWQKWIRRSAKYAAERQQPTQGALLLPLPGGGQRTSRPSTTDQRVADGLGLAARLRAEEAAQ